MTLHMIGCSHHDVAMEVRERLSFTSEQVQRLYETISRLHPSAESVLLSTCNRVELYAATSDRRDAESVMTTEELSNVVAGILGHDPATIRGHLTPRHDRAAVEHLFRVASSLDSLVVGEAQILSQVKQAYDLANLADATGPITHAVFQAANRAAKRVQTETSIHRRRLSVPSVAVGEIVPEVFETLRGKRVVLCGAGEMAEETLRYLKTGGADRICVLNRTRERGVALAKAFDTEVGTLDQLTERVVEADLLIGTTSSESPLIDANECKQLGQRRAGRLLLILDLAVPRDFDASIGDAPGVYLYQIDDLRAACDRNRREREKQLPKAHRIIEEEVLAFEASLQQRATGPVIAQLRQRADRVKQQELERLLGKLNGSHDAAITQEIQKSFDRLTNKLLHPPMASLRDDAADGHSRGLLEALRHLFNLGEDS